MKIGSMNSMVTFQHTEDNGQTWHDKLTVHAYINGVSGSEFFIANAGYDSSLTMTISCRYQPVLMKILPTEYRAVSDGVIFELISPADDIKSAHREIKFRARRLQSDNC